MSPFRIIPDPFLPIRYVGSAAKTSGNTTTTTATVDVTGLSVAFTALPNVRYRFDLTAQVFSSVALDTVNMVLTDGTTTFLVVRTVVPAGSNAVTSCFGSCFWTPAFLAPPTAMTLKAQLARGGGTGTVGHYTDSVSPSTLAVYAVQ